MMVMWGTVISFGVFFKPLLAEFGWTRATVSGAVSISVIVSGLAAIGLGRLTDRFGPRLVVTAGGCFFGFGYGGLFVLESPIVAKLFGLSAHGAIMGSIGVSYMISGALGPVLAGRIFDITGSYQTAFLISAAASVIALILALLLRLDGKKRER